MQRNAVSKSGNHLLIVLISLSDRLGFISITPLPPFLQNQTFSEYTTQRDFEQPYVLFPETAFCNVYRIIADVRFQKIKERYIFTADIQLFGRNVFKNSALILTAYANYRYKFLAADNTDIPVFDISYTAFFVIG